MDTGFFLKQQVEDLMPSLIQPSIFCAGSDVSGFGSCEGDSGDGCAREASIADFVQAAEVTKANSFSNVKFFFFVLLMG